MTADSRRLLWANLALLMNLRWGGENLNRLARECGMSPATAARIKAQHTSIGLAVLDRIALHFDVSPHQLLDPDFDPVRDTVRTAALSRMALDLARMLDAIHDPRRQDRVYAAAAAVLQLGNEPVERRRGVAGHAECAPIADRASSGA